MSAGDKSGFPSVAMEHCAMLRHDNPDNNAAAHGAEGGLKMFRMKVILTDGLWSKYTVDKSVFICLQCLTNMVRCILYSAYLG